VDKDISDRGEAEDVCAAVIDVLRPVMQTAWVDVVSDFTDVMPEPVRQAEAVLRAAGERQCPSRRDPVMAVEVAREDAEWTAVETYAAWSINLELFDGDGADLATLHDCGYWASAEMTDDEAGELRSRLGPTLPLALLAELQARRRAEKQARRRQRLRSWLPSGRHDP